MDITCFDWLFLPAYVFKFFFRERRKFLTRIGMVKIRLQHKQFEWYFLTLQ